ncbi:MAG: DUF5777 family beta-barrel protein [Akkermansia sp.]
MKSPYYLLLFGSALTISSVLPTVSAQSLYDLASPIGLNESIPLKWSANASVGYDDNVNAVSNSDPNHQSSAFSSFSVSASMAELDARTQLSFDGQIGGTFYLDKMRFGSNQAVSNTNLSAMLTHNFDTTLRYMANVSLAYQPEPDYQTGISSPRRNGDYFYTYFNNTISKSWNSRFSTTTGFNVSVLNYEKAEASTDDRDYYNLTQNFRYKWTQRAAVSVDWNGQYSKRVYGESSFSNFIYLGMEYALDKYTNATAKVGPQIKNVSGGSHVYGSAEVAVDRRMTDRMSAGIFWRLSNENVDTYSAGNFYESNVSNRVGVRGSYQINVMWSASANLNLVTSSFSKGTRDPDRKDTTWNADVSVNCMLSKSWSANASYAFTNGQYSGYGNNSSYVRNVFSLGTSYSF